MLGLKLLDEQIVVEQGSFQRIKRWWRGVHPEKGTIVRGWTGWETMEEKDRILAVGTFRVRWTPLFGQKAGGIPFLGEPIKPRPARR